MTNFDIITIVVIMVFTTISFFKGGIGSVLSLAKWYGAGVLSIMFYPEAKPYFEDIFGQSFISSGIAIFTVYIASLIVLYLITKIILILLKGIVGGVLDRFVGLLIGFTIGLLIISSVHYVIRATTKGKEPEWIKNGNTYALTSFGADILEKIFTGDISLMLKDFGVGENNQEIKNEVSEKQLKEAENIANSSNTKEDLNVEKVRKSLEELKAQGLSKDKAKKKLQKMIENNPNDFRSLDDEIKVRYEPLPE